MSVKSATVTRTSSKLSYELPTSVKEEEYGLTTFHLVNRMG